jgi:hypothetical protein
MTVTGVCHLGRLTGRGSGCRAAAGSYLALARCCRRRRRGTEDGRRGWSSARVSAVSACTCGLRALSPPLSGSQLPCASPSRPGARGPLRRWPGPQLARARTESSRRWEGGTSRCSAEPRSRAGSGPGVADGTSEVASYFAAMMPVPAAPSRSRSLLNLHQTWQAGHPASKNDSPRSLAMDPAAA